MGPPPRSDVKSIGWFPTFWRPSIFGKPDKTIRRWSSCIVVGSGSLTHLDALFLKMALGQRKSAGTTGRTYWVIPLANFVHYPNEFLLEYRILFWNYRFFLGGQVNVPESGIPSLLANTSPSRKALFFSYWISPFWVYLEYFALGGNDKLTSRTIVDTFEST